MIKRLALLIAASLLASQALAQTLPPIPPVPDADRTVTYNVTSSTQTFAVPFNIYGDCSDLSVSLSDALQPSANYSCSSASGRALNTIPLPITDMQITLAAPVASGSVVIAGAYRPRNLTVPTAPGITRREFEQTVNTVVSGMREVKRNADAGAAAVGVLPLGGDLSGHLPNPIIPPGAVTNSKMAPMLPTSVKCNIGPSPASPSDCTAMGLEGTGTSVIDIHTVQPANGIFANGNGAYFDYCSVTGCLNGPHLLGGLVTYMTTHMDASAQESAVSINFTSETGAAPNWIASHAYTLGQQVQAGPAENIYEVTVPGTSAATGTGPTFCPSSTYLYCFAGSGADASTGTDGTITWKFIGAGINNGKSGVSVACHIKDGSGHFWCMNYSVVIDPQTSITPGFGFEMDTTNNSGHNYDVGGAIALPIFINGNNANRMTAAIGVFTGGDPVIKAFFDGILFNGDNQILQDTFADATSAIDVFHCLGAPHTHTNCFFDESISDISVKIGGTKRVGVDTSTATLTSALAINTAENTFYSFNNGLNLMGWNSAISALTYGPTNSGTAFSFASYDNGDFAIEGLAKIAGNISLTGAASNVVYFGQNGVGLPGTAGEKISLFGGIGVPANSDYSIGVNGNDLWLNSPSAVTTRTNGVLTASFGPGGHGFPKLAAAPTTAPGAGLVQVFAVAGTNSGTCKLQAQAGTSTTAATILDNIGTGC